MGEQSNSWRLDRIFWLLVAVAIALRVLAFDAYSAHHPDESIQYLEQAHRLVFGYGVVPWEFRYHIRSWLIPLFMAGPMQIGEWIDPGGTLYLILPRALIAAINFSPVLAAWFIGARVSRRHAIVAMAVMAIWVESVLFSVQSLSESLAVACFLPAVAMLRADAKARRLALAGFLMAVAGLLRFQYAPAIAVFALLVAGRDWRMWRWLILGGVPVVIGGAAIDLVMGLTPYEWILNNYEMNITNDRMRKIGGVSHWTYLTDIPFHLGIAAVALFVLPLLAGRRFDPLLIAAWVNIVFHQMIGHKEWRYLWLSVAILVVLAAIGSVNATRGTWFGFRIKRPRQAVVVGGIVAAWGALSLLLASGEFYREYWRADGVASRLAAAAARDPRVCGLAVNRHKNTLFGFAMVHRPIPLYLIEPEGPVSLSRPSPHDRAFNAILVDTTLPPPRGFAERVACGGGGRDAMCLYRRPGGCSPNAADRELEHQARLLATDM